MNSKLWFLIAISLFLNSVSLVYAELPAELKGPFYTLTKSKSDNEVDSGLANLDRSKNNEAKIKSSLLGDVSVYSSDSEDAQTYHTLYSSADSEPFIYYGAMQGTADSMQSEALVKLVSENLTGAVPVYLSAVAMTEPALHDSLTESLAYSQRTVSQGYQQEQHFLGQLEQYPILRRFVSERYKTCINAFTKKSGGKKKSWIAAQAACLGDSYKAVEETFKEVDEGHHFSVFDNDKSSADIIKEYETGGKTVSSWLFIKEIEALDKIQSQDENQSKLIAADKSKLEEAMTQWLNLVGDISMELKPKSDNEKHIITITKAKVEGKDGKKPSEVLDILAEERYNAILSLVKKKCDHEASGQSDSAHKAKLTNNTKAYFDPSADDLKLTSAPGWQMDKFQLDLLYNLFTMNTNLDENNNPDCKLLENSGESAFSSISKTEGRDKILAWAQKYQTLAFLLGGLDRQFVLAGMWRFVSGRAGTTAGSIGLNAYAGAAFELIQSKSGFDSPEIGIQSIYAELQGYWAGISEEVKNFKDQKSSVVAAKEGE